MIKRPTPSRGKTVGILALHGDVAEHREVLELLKANVVEVRTPKDLALVDRLIIPGGESTVMEKLLETSGLRKAIADRVKEGTLPVYGTCAGAILIARKAKGLHAPNTLQLIDIDVERNAYGTQTHSFETSLRVKGSASPVRVAFIRAPKIGRVGKDVEVLAAHEGKPVLVKQGSVLAGTFHPEIRGRTDIHRLFLEL